MATIQTTKLKDRMKNDTSSSVKFTHKNGVGVPIDITGWTFRIQFRYKGKTGKVALDVTDGSGITIVDAVNGIIQLDAFKLTWVEGLYFFDIQCVKDNGDDKTFIQGSMKVIQDTTNED